MNNPNAFALLVGVGDYQTFDPTGRTDLKGPPNDVAGWLHIVRDLGIPPENIRICVSPAMPETTPADELRGVTVGGTKHAELRAAMQWLVDSLSADDASKAILTWSGHGTMTDAGEVLCPSDVQAEGDTLRNGMPLSEIKAVLDLRDSARITAFVDTCFTNTGFEDTVGTARSRALQWSAKQAASAESPSGAAHDAFGDLVTMSSQPDTVSYELPVLGGVRGAFSWAASNLIHRYGLVDGVDGATSGLTFNALVELSHAILNGMVIEQTPRFVGGELAGEQRVFSTFGDLSAPAAPQSLPGQEIWPGVPDGKVLYATLKTPSGSPLGTVYVTGNAGSSPNGWANDQQYWQWFSGSWPTASFEIGQPWQANVSAMSPPTSALCYEEGPLDASQSGSVNVQGSFAIAASSGGTPLGYLTPSSGELTVHSVQSKPGTSLFSYDVPAYCTLQTTSLTVSYSARAIDHAK